MPALAQYLKEDLHNRAANDDDINGGSGTRTKYSYDNAGNTLGDGTRTFTYNAAGRMKSAAAAGLTTTYTYNALGQRILKSNSLGITLFVYDEAGRLVGEYDGAGQLVEEIVWLGDVPVASVRPGQSGGVGVFYINTDHLNAPVSLSRANDNVIVWQSSSDPYGAGVVLNDPDGNGSNVTFNLRFPGQYYDAETGLNYNYERDYDPAVGRYVESDPIGLNGGSDSTYAYVNGDPIDDSDPMGLAPPGRAQPFPFPPGPFTFPAPSAESARQAGLEIEDSISRIAQAIKNACTNDNDFCYQRWEQEDQRCSQWKGLGSRVVAACKVRAANRRNLCVGNKGRPNPLEPPEYNPFRDFPR